MRFGLSLALLACVAAHAGDERTLRIDPERSSVRFTLEATLHRVEGNFEIERGRLVFDPTSGDLRGSIVVDGESGATGNEKRDRKMHGRVLETYDHPEIHFRPKAFRGDLATSGTSRIEVDGTLRLHGENHPLTIAADVEIAEDEVVVRTKFTVPYVKWGMRDPSAFVLRVAKTVDVEVELVGTLSAP